MTQTQRHVTRFISLARVGNKEKNKWIYAFNIVPLKCLNKSDLVAQPNVVTDMPYNESHMKVCMYLSQVLQSNALFSFNVFFFISSFLKIKLLNYVYTWV